MFKVLLLSASLFLSAQPLFGFTLEGVSWTLNRTVQMQLSLGPPRRLSDGFDSFNQSAADALNIWNTHLAHMRFQPVRPSPVTPSGDDVENSVFFSNTVFGDSFGSGTLAVTLISDRQGTLLQTDTLFNNVYQWDSYSGPLRADGVLDLHRVALHEFGHTLGLDHPDEAGQSVAAIMNSRISDRSTLSSDDIAGVESLYSRGPNELNAIAAPVLENLSTRGLVSTGDKVLIGGFIVQGPGSATVILRAIGFSLSSLGVGNGLHDSVLTVYDSAQRQIARNDDWITSPSAETIASYHLDPPNSIESAVLLTLKPGAYTATIASYDDPNQPAQDGIALFELYDLHTTNGRAGNISTRGQVLGGNNVLIGGFIIGGPGAKPIVVRALGPSLGAALASQVLADPKLELRDGNGNLLQANDNWQNGPDATAIAAEGFGPTDPRESALQATLAPGSYTAVVSGVRNATGIGLVEIYDMSARP